MLQLVHEMAFDSFIYLIHCGYIVNHLENSWTDWGKLHFLFFFQGYMVLGVLNAGYWTVVRIFYQIGSDMFPRAAVHCLYLCEVTSFDPGGQK